MSADRFVRGSIAFMPMISTKCMVAAAVNAEKAKKRAANGRNGRCGLRLMPDRFEYDRYGGIVKIKCWRMVEGWKC